MCMRKLSTSVFFFIDTTFSSIPKPCYCPQPCQQTTYDVRVSYALFLSDETGSLWRVDWAFPQNVLSNSHFLFHISYSFLIVSYSQIIHPWERMTLFWWLLVCCRCFAFECNVYTSLSTRIKKINTVWLHAGM